MEPPGRKSDSSTLRVYRGYGALRHGRVSQAHSTYFITLCLERPLTGLVSAPLLEAIKARLHTLESGGRWTLRTYVVMPDHLHVLATLGSDAVLSDALRNLKGALTPALRQAGLRWQASFYDRRLRPDDDILPVFLYIFLNPYRAGLLGDTQIWPGYYCGAEDWTWFGGLTREAVPFPEWLR